MNLRTSDFTTALRGTPFATCADAAPWQLTQSIQVRVHEALARLDAAHWRVHGDVAVHFVGDAMIGRQHRRQPAQRA